MQENNTAPSLRWGLLAASRIAGRFALDLRAAGMAVAAVASRDAGRAAKFALDNGIPRYHASYPALLADPEVDAVYISLPNHLHAEWSIRAARAGKHVLCEKPAALDERECREVIAAAGGSGVFFMEGFMYRFHPIWDRVREILEAGRIGDTGLLHASFCYDMGLNLANIRQSREAGGGALLDVGCYCLSLIRWLARGEPSALSAVARVGRESGVDEWTCAALGFPSGLGATFQCALRAPQPQSVIIYGTKGRLEIPSPWHPSRDKAVIKLVAGGKEEVHQAGDGLGLFARGAMKVARHLQERQCPLMSWEDSLGQARALEGLRKSAGLM